MPILFWVVYPFAIWTACFGAVPTGVSAADETREP